jgi:arachidonate 5-lipoxygenase
MGNCSNVPADFEVVVKTGDVKGAGTDANVYCALVDEEGNRTKDYHLDCRWKDDFEKGNIDKFKLCNGSTLGPLKKIEIWRDETGLGDDWYVEWIKVKRLADLADELDVFPCNRWVKADRKLILTKYDCMLPQFDDHPEQRKLELEEKRKLYVLIRKAPGCPKQVQINTLHLNEVM